MVTSQWTPCPWIAFQEQKKAVLPSSLCTPPRFKDGRGENEVNACPAPSQSVISKHEVLAWESCWPSRAAACVELPLLLACACSSSESFRWDSPENVARSGTESCSPEGLACAGRMGAWEGRRRWLCQGLVSLGLLELCQRKLCVGG